jgi:hypothetical protein
VVLELSNTFDPTGNGEPANTEEQNVAQLYYQQFTTWFSKEHVTIVGGAWVHPLYIFQRSLVEFGAALVFYKRLEPHCEPLSTPQTLEHEVRHAFPTELIARLTSFCYRSRLVVFIGQVQIYLQQ